MSYELTPPEATRIKVEKVPVMDSPVLALIAGSWRYTVQRYWEDSGWISWGLSGRARSLEKAKARGCAHRDYKLEQEKKELLKRQVYIFDWEQCE